MSSPQKYKKKKYPRTISKLDDASTYFVLNPRLNTIKIGIAYDVDKRLGSLQTANCEKLVLLHFERTNREEEFHKQFADIRIRGEWFKATARLTNFIEELKKEALESTVIRTHNSSAKKVIQLVISMALFEKACQAVKGKKNTSVNDMVSAALEAYLRKA